MKLPTWTTRAAWTILLIESILIGVIGGSSAFYVDPSDPFPHDAGVLIATFAAGMAILGIALILTGFRRGEFWAWLALWYYPIFFVIHVLAFGTIMPDGLFAALAVVALLLRLPSRVGQERVDGSPAFRSMAE